MNFNVPLGAHENLHVTLQIDDDLCAARHLDGVAVWWRSPGFETLADLLPSSPDGPYAPGGVAFLRAHAPPSGGTFAEAATRMLSAGPAKQQIEHGVWEGAAGPCASMTWTDGVADVTSVVIQWSNGILLTVEASRDLWRERKLGLFGTDRRDLLAVLRQARPVETSAPNEPRRS